MGSSRGDHRVETTLLGQRIIIERIGTNGDYPTFCRKLRELDGHVDAIGLGGINLVLLAGGRRYYLRDAVRAIQGIRTPVVDGSGIKEGWEPDVVARVLPEEAGIALRGRRVLMVLSVDRYAMAEAFVHAGADVVFGDFMFGLGIPIALRGLTTIKVLAAVILPITTRLPYTWFYPTGKKQEDVTPRFGRAYRWAEIIAGDYHVIQRYMPDDLSGKTIVTQTITPGDVEDLRRRRVALLVTTTPEIAGRSFATNVYQATIVALSGRRPEELTPVDYVDWMRRAGFRPRIERLTPSA